MSECDDDFDLGWLDLTWPSNLGKALSDGGALCAAWYQGSRYQLQRYILRFVAVDNFDWTPGCGREALRCVP